MRQIGTFPTESDARLLEDYLLAEGIETSVRPHGDDWSLWVIREEHLARSVAAVDAYRADPADPRYREASRAAREVRRRSEAADRAYEKQVVDVRSRWLNIQMRARPVTTALVAACVVLFLATEFLRPDPITPRLLLPTLEPGLDGRAQWGLRGLQRGEVWRLITPILLHGGPLHLVMNMAAFWAFAGAVESRYGGRFLALFVGVAAVVSNAGEAFYELNTSEGLRPFLGMSGVVFALFALVFFRSRTDPTFGYAMSQQTVTYSLVFLLLCFTGIFGPIALAAHSVGLLVGVVFGLTGS